MGVGHGCRLLLVRQALTFLRCSHPQKLQQLADSLTAQDLLSCGQKWLACLTPFFKRSSDSLVDKWVQIELSAEE